MTEMVVVVYCSLSESILSTYSKTLTLLADVTVSYLAVDSLLHHPTMDLVSQLAVMLLSLVLYMIWE